MANTAVGAEGGFFLALSVLQGIEFSTALLGMAQTPKIIDAPTSLARTVLRRRWRSGNLQKKSNLFFLRFQEASPRNPSQQGSVLEI